MTDYMGGNSSGSRETNKLSVQAKGATSAQGGGGIVLQSAGFIGALGVGVRWELKRTAGFCLSRENVSVSH